MAGKYRPIPRGDAAAKGREEGNDRTSQLWAVIIGVFVLAMIFALRAPAVPEGGGGIPAASHRGHAVKHHASSSATASELGFEAEQAIEAGGSVVDAPSFTAPSFSGPSFSAPSFSAPSFDAPSPDAAQPSPPARPPPPAATDSNAAAAATGRDADGRGENPYIKKYVTQDLRNYWAEMEAKRKGNSDSIRENFGTWAPGGATMCHGCWTEDKSKDPQVNTVVKGECECDGHHYDNQSNWDMGRREFCGKLNADYEKAHPFPDELKYVLELSYKDGLDENGDMKVPYRALESGSPSGELPFDPVKVKDHFLRLRAALTIYYQGEHILEDMIQPPPSDPQYLEVMKAISAKFASAFVSSDPIVVGTLGDSTVAGADNCWWDAWPQGLQRQLAPFFGAAKIDFTVRDGGHNGGFGMAAQTVCANTIGGNDMDFLLQSSPFVHPDGNAPTVLEDMTRRAILAGVIVNIACDAPDFWKTYAKWGMFNGGRWTGKPYGYNWYPSQGKSNWGRIGDALCHVESTRSGSAAVMSRNWHPGPLGHQGDQDSRVFLWADAAIMALDDVIAGLKETGGKTGPLKQRWPKRPKVSAADLPTPKGCENVDMNAPHFKQLCGADSPVNHGWPVCYTTLQPQGTPGNSLADNVVTEGAPDWGGDTPEHEVKHVGPKSPLPRDDTCRTPAECKRTHHSRIGTVETQRSFAACNHQDFEDELILKKGFTTIKIAKGSLRLGTISVCGECKDKKTPEFMIQADGVAKKKVTPSEWDRSKEWHFADPKCGTIVETLDAKARGGDVFIGVKCGEGGGTVRYVFGQ